MNAIVDKILSKAKQWKVELGELRSICLQSGLTEELKWGQPCYTYEGKNVVLIHGFKEYCGIMFFKGVLMKDPKKILIQQTDNVQATRQVRFQSLEDVVKLKKVLLSYIKETIAIEKSGEKIVLKKTKEYPVPEELKAYFQQDEVFNKAFHKLTPGRQRGYLLHFAAPKQSQTRISRIEKTRPQILAGKGLTDNYKTSNK